MTAARISVVYALIATAATLANLACQVLAGRLWAGPHAITVSLAVGTLAGLPVKYVLEKRYVFEFRAASMADDGERFVLYSLLGVAPTLVFWSTEYTCDALFFGGPMRYVGAVAGLALGYVIKYRLDKRYVFCARARVRWGT